MARIVVFTEQVMLAEGFRSVFESAGEFKLCGVFTEAKDLIETLHLQHPQVALVDGASISGPQVLRQMLSACQACRFVLWAEDVSIETVRHAFEAGMAGGLSCRSAPGALLSALRRIAGGELYFPEVYCTPGQLAGSTLRPREKQLMAMLSQGLKNKEIAGALNLTEGTVKVYLSRMYRRLGVTDRFDVALLGLHEFFGNWKSGPAGAPGAPLRKNPPGAEARRRPEFLDD